MSNDLDGYRSIVCGLDLHQNANAKSQKVQASATLPMSINNELLFQLTPTHMFDAFHIFSSYIMITLEADGKLRTYIPLSDFKTLAKLEWLPAFFGIFTARVSITKDSITAKLYRDDVLVETVTTYHIVDIYPEYVDIVSAYVSNHKCMIPMDLYNTLIEKFSKLEI